MSGMFSNCKSLQELDLGQFDTSNVTNMTEMFAEDSELKTIYASDSFVIGNKIKSDNMFLNCSSIV
jgi:surface protein